MSNPAAPSTPSDTRSPRRYHGTRADLKPGDLIQPGYSSNFTDRRSPWVYFSETLHAATALRRGSGTVVRVVEVVEVGEAARRCRAEVVGEKAKLDAFEPRAPHGLAAPKRREGDAIQGV